MLINISLAVPSIANEYSFREWSWGRRVGIKLPNIKIKTCSSRKGNQHLRSGSYCDLRKDLHSRKNRSPLGLIRTQSRVFFLLNESSCLEVQFYKHQTLKMNLTTFQWEPVLIGVVQQGLPCFQYCANLSIIRLQELWSKKWNRSSPFIGVGILELQIGSLRCKRFSLTLKGLAVVLVV